MSALADLIISLQSSKVPFLIIGGHAVSASGYSRTTGDIDLLLGETVVSEMDLNEESTRQYICKYVLLKCMKNSLTQKKDLKLPDFPQLEENPVPPLSYAEIIAYCESMLPIWNEKRELLINHSMYTIQPFQFLP